MHTPHVMSGGRYPVLRALAILYVLAAALIAVAAVLTTLYAMVTYHLAALDRLIVLAATLAGGFILVISSLAVAELLKLFIDIEHNTRMNAPGLIGMPSHLEAGQAVGSGNGPANRINALDEETAESALLRGH
jgi:hypothetical protein